LGSRRFTHAPTCPLPSPSSHHGSHYLTLPLPAPPRRRSSHFLCFLRGFGFSARRCLPLAACHSPPTLPGRIPYYQPCGNVHCWRRALHSPPTSARGRLARTFSVVLTFWFNSAVLFVCISCLHYPHGICCLWLCSIVVTDIPDMRIVTVL